MSGGWHTRSSILTLAILASLIAAPWCPFSQAANVNRPIRDKWALIVGISDFSDPARNLRYAAKDARDFRNYLVKEARFDPDHVRLLTNSAATRENIMEELGDRWLPRVVGADDLVVLYISSHGSPSDADVVGVNYILAYDTKPGALYATGLPTQDLIRMIRSRIKSDRIVLILDACFSGAAADPDPSGAFKQRSLDIDEFAYGTGQLVICSSQPDEISAEAPDLHNGVFTYYLIDGLRQHGVTTTLTDAFSYCKEKVEEYARRHGSKQTPVLKSKWEGSGLVLATLPGDTGSASPAPAATTVAVALPGITPPVIQHVAPPAVPPQTAPTQPSNLAWGQQEAAGAQAEKMGNLAEAEQHYRLAIHEAEKFGPSDLRLGASLNRLAILLNQTMRSKEAEKLSLQALGIYKLALGPDHRFVASLLANLGKIKESLGEYKSSEELYGQALAIMREKLGPDDPHLATALGHLGDLAMKEGRYDDAAQRMKRALEIKQKVYGHQSKQVAIQLNSLALLNESRHQDIDAELQYQKALQIMEKTLPGDSIDIASTMNNLGRLYATQGRYDKAEPLIARAVEIHREKKTSDYPIALYQLADVYTGQGRYSASERLYQDALGIARQNFGPEHPVVAAALHGLGNLYCKEKRYAQCESCLEQALSLKEKLYSANHQEIAASCVELANAYRDDKKYEKADPLYRRALDIYTRVLGSKSWDVYYTAKKYWRLLELSHRTAEAEKMRTIWAALEPQFAK